MQTLADVQRAVVTLRMLDDVAGEDVAQALGITPGHVAVLLHRAKINLLDLHDQIRREPRRCVQRSLLEITDTNFDTLALRRRCPC